MTTSSQAHPTTESVSELAGEALFVEQARAYYRDLKAVAQNAPFGQTFNNVEDAIIPASRKLVQQSFEIVMQEQINDFEKKKETRLCPTCQAKTRHQGYSEKTRLTAIGPVKLKRCYDECRPCNILRHIADIPFGLEGKYTIGLRRLAVCAGTDHSFKRASEDLYRYTGIELSRETIRELCQQEAPKIEQWQATSSEACADFIASHGAVEVMIDGTCVNTMEGWRETKILTVTTRPFGEGVLPEQWTKRKLPHTNVRFASAGVEDKEAFHKRLSFCRSRLRLGTKGDISVLADGAAWIWDLSRAEFGKGRECLDIYHALKHLSHVGNVLYGTGTEAYTQWQEETTMELLSEGFVLLERRLDCLESEELEALAKEAIRLLRVYLENNRERLCYCERLLEGRVIGTGQVEGACKNMIGRRLKQTGARWQVPRVNRMAILCALRYGDQWNNYWKHAT